MLYTIYNVYLIIFIVKESEINRLNFENQKLSDQYRNQTIEAQQTENNWIQLKDTYLNDKDRMTHLFLLYFIIYQYILLIINYRYEKRNAKLTTRE